MSHLLFISLRFLDVLDILLFAFLLYQVYRLLRGTNAIHIFFGVFALYLLWLFVNALDMQLLSSILGQFIGVGVIALIIVFQPELRKGLLLLGKQQFSDSRFSFFRYLLGNVDYQGVNVSEILTACRGLSYSKTGALIVLQRTTNLSSFVTIKDILDAETSSRLLVNIFFKNSPLHDGAVIIRGKRIWAARCVLPVSEKQLPEELGLRHRAAVGITEQSDAVVVVVSEETGEISYVNAGNIRRNIKTKELGELLSNDFSSEKTDSNARNKDSYWWMKILGKA